MICRNCRWGAELNNGIAQPDHGALHDIVVYRVAEAKRMHACCPGETWCDCQHQLPVRSAGAHPTLNK